MRRDYREARYDKYCETCIFLNLKEHEDPCAECLDIPYNEYTDKPINWKEKE